MTRKFSELQRIDNNRRITYETSREFLYNLQHGLLLALKERGTLNEMQYRAAAERMNALQYRSVKTPAKEEKT